MTDPVVIGCTNHGCKVKWPTRIGIGTNGSCHCLREIRDTSLQLTVERALAARDAEIDRLTQRVADLQQFHDWAEPQITDLSRGRAFEPPPGEPL